MEKFLFMTVKEFSEQLRVQRDQVYKWIHDGRIKALRVTNSEKSPWRIPHTELKKFHAQAYEEEESF